MTQYFHYITAVRFLNFWLADNVRKCFDLNPKTIRYYRLASVRATVKLVIIPVRPNSHSPRPPGILSFAHACNIGIFHAAPGNMLFASPKKRNLWNLFKQSSAILNWISGCDRRWNIRVASRLFWPTGVWREKWRSVKTIPFDFCTNRASFASTKCQMDCGSRHKIESLAWKKTRTSAFLWSRM